ncbi:MAG: protein kinase domain-containing protein, partial [Acidimicrobiia bacterium]
MTELIDDRYELLEVIASGGMATVWRARDMRLDGVVALKRPHPTPDSDEAIHRRMDREARAAASLNHPNVVTVYDYGNDDEGPFLVMELAEGPTLDQVAPKIGAPAVTEIGVQLAEALAAIHAAGIVHRD